MNKKIYILPTLFTTGNFFCGLLAIIYAINGRYNRGAIVIFFAMLFDFMDGQIARLNNATTRFGFEYDSLCDVVSFGIAPTLLIYCMSLREIGRMGITIAFIYSVCCALRLARFNAQPAKEGKKSFQGLPTTAAAGTIASSIILFDNISFYLYFISLLMLFLAYLMVSTIPYPALSPFHLKDKKPFFYLVFFILIIAMMIFNPELFLFCCFMFYVSWGVFNVLPIGSHLKDAVNTFLFNEYTARERVKNRR